MKENRGYSRVVEKVLKKENREYSRVVKKVLKKTEDIVE